ncbi:hypothetical protein AMAG_15548, partial [Allomyces macrogynus ATCC 38327]
MLSLNLMVPGRQFAVTADLVVPPGVQVLTLSPLASETDALTIMARVPASVKSLQLGEHLTPAALRCLADVPRPDLASIDLHGMTDSSECLMSLAPMLHDGVTKLSFHFVSGTLFDESAWAMHVAKRTPKLRQVRLAGCTMTSDGVAQVIDTLPKSELVSFWLDVGELEVVKKAVTHLLARDWEHICEVGFAGQLGQLPTEMREAMEGRGWKIMLA